MRTCAHAHMRTCAHAYMHMRSTWRCTGSAHAAVRSAAAPRPHSLPLPLRHYRWQSRYRSAAPPLAHLGLEALDGVQLLAGRGGVAVTLCSDPLYGLELRRLRGLLPGVLLIYGLQLRVQSAVIAHHRPPLRHHRPTVLAHHGRRGAGGRGRRGGRGPGRGVHGGPLRLGRFGPRHERQQAMRFDVRGELKLEQLRPVARPLELRLELLPLQAELAQLGPQALELLLLLADGLGLPPTERLGLARPLLRHRRRHLRRLAPPLRLCSLLLERGGLVGHAAQRGGLLLVEGLLPRARQAQLALGLLRLRLGPTPAREQRALRSLRARWRAPPAFRGGRRSCFYNGQARQRSPARSRPPPPEARPARRRHRRA